MKTITINQKDIDKAKLSNSPSGMLIDELAYASGQWTSEDMYGNNFEYEPYVPYQYNYENDLFEHTKTATDLLEIASKLNVYIVPNDKMLKQKPPLQAGANCALNMPEKWDMLLEAYTEKLKQDRTDGISETYNKELQDEIDSYHDDLYSEWLNGDHGNYAGVVHEIARYFTDERDGSYTPYNHDTKTEASYTFTLNEDDMEKYKEAGYRSNQIKGALIDEIVASGNARKAKEQAENEKRRAERERLQAYKKEQAEKKAEDRKAKLLSMTIN